MLNTVSQNMVGGSGGVGGFINNINLANAASTIANQVVGGVGEASGMQFGATLNGLGAEPFPPSDIIFLINIHNVIFSYDKGVT